MKPQRMCTVCRTMKDKEGMFRVVKNSDGVFVDKDNKLQGRGAYICKTAQCVLAARKRTALERSLSCKVDSDVYDILEDLVKDAE